MWRRGGLVLGLMLALAGCAGSEPQPQPVTVAPPRDIQGEMRRAVAVIDDQVRFADNGVYNRFSWMTDGSFCYLVQSKLEIRRSCFQPDQVDAGSVAARGAGGLGAPYDRVGVVCRRAGCMRTSSQLTSMFGPRGYRYENALSMPTRRGGGATTAHMLRRLLALAAQAGPPAL